MPILADPPFTPQDQAALLAMFEEAIRAIDADDSTAWAGEYVEDGLLQPPNGPSVRGRAALEEWARPFFPAIEEVAFSRVEIHGEGSLAWATSGYTLQVKDQAPDTGKQLVVFRRSAEGAWRIVAASFNSDLPAGEQQKDASISAGENEAVVRRLWYEELWNRWNVDAADQLFTSDYRLHLAGSPTPLDRAATKEAVAMFGRAFPDLEHTVEEMIAEGDTVTARWTVRGHHTGAFQGIAPTGTEVTNTGITVHHMREGRICETWLAYDSLSFLQQLGSPTQAAEA